MRLAWLPIAALLVACSGGSKGAPTTPTSSANPGLTTVVSGHTFADTLARLQAAIIGKGLIVFTTIDHGANAKRAGLTLQSTAVIIFGKPQVGTQLMNTNRTVAIDLPQKMLVWKDGGTVRITYNDPAWLQARHKLDAKSALLAKVTKLLGALANKAASTD